MSDQRPPEADQPSQIQAIEHKLDATIAALDQTRETITQQNALIQDLLRQVRESEASAARTPTSMTAASRSSSSQHSQTTGDRPDRTMPSYLQQDGPSVDREPPRSPSHAIPDTEIRLGDQFHKLGNRDGVRVETYEDQTDEDEPDLMTRMFGGVTESLFHPATMPLAVRVGVVVILALILAGIAIAMESQAAWLTMLVIWVALSIPIIIFLGWREDDEEEMLSFDPQARSAGSPSQPHSRRESEVSSFRSELGQPLTNYDVQAQRRRQDRGGDLDHLLTPGGPGAPGRNQPAYQSNPQPHRVSTTHEQTPAARRDQPHYEFEDHRPLQPAQRGYTQPPHTPSSQRDAYVPADSDVASNEAEIARLRQQLGVDADDSQAAPVPSDEPTQAQLAANEAEIQRLRRELEHARGRDESTDDSTTGEDPDRPISAGAHHLNDEITHRPLESFTYPDLQHLAKTHGIRASQKKQVLIDELCAMGVGFSEQDGSDASSQLPPSSRGGNGRDTSTD